MSKINKELNKKDRMIADVILNEINTRLQFLMDVGLEYLTLSRSAGTLSGGEAQRVKLATELSRRSTGKTVYILDEPTTGLHFYDVEKLLKSFDALLAKGHSIVVVEHNLDVIKTADYLIDLGPDGGDNGGEIVFTGRLGDEVSSLMKQKSLTLQYLQGDIRLLLTKTARFSKSGDLPR